MSCPPISTAYHSMKDRFLHSDMEDVSWDLHDIIKKICLEIGVFWLKNGAKSTYSHNWNRHVHPALWYRSAGFQYHRAWYSVRFSASYRIFMSGLRDHACLHRDSAWWPARCVSGQCALRDLTTGASFLFRRKARGIYQDRKARPQYSRGHFSTLMLFNLCFICYS